MLRLSLCAFLLKMYVKTADIATLNMKNPAAENLIFRDLTGILLR